MFVQVSHDGTWHLQASGSKVWHLEPTEELRRIAEDSSTLPPGEIDITCETGDLLLVNTRLWWHRTTIPDTADAEDKLSVSYARDIRIDGDGGESSSMTNVEGLFATKEIDEGDVIMTAGEMPDVCLPVSKHPNCEVADTEDGELVLVATRAIREGEFFTVGSDSDSDSEDGDCSDDD